MRFNKAIFFSLFLYSSVCFAADTVSGDEKGGIKHLNIQKTSLDVVPIIKHSTMSNVMENLSHEFLQLAKQYKSTDNFSDKTAKDISTNNWTEMWKLLKISSAFGNRDATEFAKTLMESKKYSRDCADCLIAGYEDSYDLKEVRAFFWEHLALVDEQEKEGLIKAYSEGNLVPLSTEKAGFWRTYRQ